MKDLNEKELREIEGGLGGVPGGFLMWAIGEYHDMTRGCQDALDEWVE